MELATLTRLGLTPGELKIYQTLLEQGALPIAELIEASGLKKGDCYNKTYDLIKKGLIEEYDFEKKKHFRLTDPRKLEEVATSLYMEAGKLKHEVESLLPEIISAYTLTYHAPGALFFEGEEAMRRVLEDTLAAKSEVVQYADVDAFTNYFPEVNATYVKRRSHLKQHKRVILPDTPSSRRYVQRQKVELFGGRFLPAERTLENVSMYIYDNKISYLTLQQNKIVGIIIEDPLLSAMHRQIFEFTWEKALQ